MTALAESLSQPLPQPLVVRRATEADAQGISTLIAENVLRGDVLPRSPENIRETVDDWVIGERDGQILACGSLWIYSTRRAEVRTLVVHSSVRGLGWGQAVVEVLVAEARRRQIEVVFALTRSVVFFERCGFEVVDKSIFPEKVWKDCQACPLLHACDETAMILSASLAHMAATGEPQPASGS